MKIKFQQINKITLKESIKKPVLFWLCSPNNYSNQNIYRFSYNLISKSEYYSNNNKIVFFEESAEKKEILFNIELEGEFNLQEFDLVNDNLNKDTINKNIRYLTNQKYLETNNSIKETATNIVKNADSDTEKVYLLSVWMKKNFQYTYPVMKRGVENIDINNPQGDCGEAGSLFVALCRSVGIPSFNKTGFVVYFDELNNAYEHGWTSVLINDKFIDIDPLAENISKIQNVFRYTQKNYFISFCEEFDININPKIPNEYDLDYWLNLGLPINHETVQVMQPFIFLIPKGIKFELNSEIKINS